MTVGVTDAPASIKTNTRRLLQVLAKSVTLSFSAIIDAET
jgi:hypothetical protein